MNSKDKSNQGPPPPPGQDPVRLEYTRLRRPFNFLRVARWVVLAVVVVVGVAIGVIFAPRLIGRADAGSAFRQMMRAQRECMNYSPAVSLVVYEEDPTAGDKLLATGGYEYVSRTIPKGPGNRSDTTPAAVYTPECWKSFTEAADNTGLPPAYLNNGGAGAVFLHARRLTNGTERLVCVRVAYGGSPTLVVQAFEPSDGKVLPRLVSSSSALQFARRPGGPTLRLKAGQADPRDPSHFTIPFEIGGRSAVVDGWLREKGVELLPRGVPIEAVHFLEWDPELTTPEVVRLTEPTRQLTAPSLPAALATRPAAEPFEATFRAVALSPDGKLLAAVDETRVVVWDLARGRVRHFLDPPVTAGPAGPSPTPLGDQRPSPSLLQSVAFVREGRAVAGASSDGTLYLWSLEGGAGEDRVPRLPVRSFRGDGQAGNRQLSVSPDGKMLAMACFGYRDLENPPPLRLWNPVTSNELGGRPAEQPAVAVAFSPDGRKAVVLNPPPSRNTDFFLTCLDRASGSVLWERPVQTVRRGAVAYSPDGTEILFGGQDVFLLSAATGKERLICEMPDRSRYIGWVQFSADGQWFAAGAGERNPVTSGSCFVWDYPAANTACEVSPGDRLVGVGLALSADGKTVASAEGDEIVRIWSAASASPDRLKPGPSTRATRPPAPPVSRRG